MKHPIDDIIGFISGLFGGGIYLAINWQRVWDGVGNLLWLGVIAMFSGAMGILGKHLASKYLKRKKK